jgi:hypothetical protein
MWIRIVADAGRPAAARGLVLGRRKSAYFAG